MAHSRGLLRRLGYERLVLPPLWVGRPESFGVAVPPGAHIHSGHIVELDLESALLFRRRSLPLLDSVVEHAQSLASLVYR